MTIRHAKLTEHFLAAAKARGLTGNALCRFFSALTDGSLFATAEKIAPERGAVMFGDHWIVFCVDSVDPGLLALLTVMDRDESECLGRRRDTSIVSLGPGGPIALRPMCRECGSTLEFAGKAPKEGDLVLCDCGWIAEIGKSGLARSLTYDSWRRLRKTCREVVSAFWDAMTELNGTEDA